MTSLRVWTSSQQQRADVSTMSSWFWYQFCSHSWAMSQLCINADLLNLLLMHLIRSVCSNVKHFFPIFPRCLTDVSILLFLMHKPSIKPAGVLPVENMFLLWMFLLCWGFLVRLENTTYPVMQPSTASLKFAVLTNKFHDFRAKK